MHLPELPTIFVKNGEERKVYFTVQARELSEMGWVEKGKKTTEPKKVVKEEPPKVVKEVAPPAPVSKFTPKEVATKKGKE